MTKQETLALRKTSQWHDRQAGAEDVAGSRRELGVGLSASDNPLFEAIQLTLNYTYITDESRTPQEDFPNLSRS
jgi:hypothetical protein